MLTKTSFTDLKVKFKKISYPALIKILLCLFVIYITVINWDIVIRFLDLVKDREAIIEYVNSYGALGPVLLATAIFLQIIIAVIPGHLLMFACGYLYGFPLGFLLTYVITVLSSQITFMIARKAGKPLVYRLASKKLIDKWNRGLDKQGIVFFTFSFMLPIFPADVMSYVAGLASISPGRYLVANLIGHIPVAVLMNLAGAYGFELTTGWAVSIVVVGIAALIFWLRYQKKISEKLNIPQESAK